MKKHGKYKWCLAAPVLVFLFSIPAMAGEKPPEIARLISAEQPYGKSSLHTFLFHVYDAELWTDAKPWSYDAPFALSLTYHATISARELADKSIEEMDRLQPLDEAEKKRDRAILISAFIDVKDGDRITAVYMPKKGIVFYGNGMRRASVVSTGFARQFLDIWLSGKTSQPALRKQLLAGGE